MVINLKDTYLKKIDEIEEIISKYGNKFDENDLKMIEEIKNFHLKVLMLGVFNAGKSTLLNKFLNEKGLLKVNSEAETAVPCELKYSLDEKTLVYKENGDIVQKDRNYIVRAEEGSEIKFLEKFINNTQLRKYKDMILVDMPGLDSSNRVHDMAIENYINSGAYYILLIDPENGGIKDSTENFLRKILKYPEQFSVLLTKTDMSSSYNCEEVRKNLKYRFEEENLDIFIGKTDRNNYCDFEEILKNIDYNNIIKNIFRDKIIYMKNFKLELLKYMLNNRNLDVTEIEENIELQKQKYIEIEKKIIREKDTFSGEKIKKEVVGELRQVLDNNFNELKLALKTGNSSFENKIKSILSLELRDIIEKKLNSRIRDLEQDLSDFRIQLSESSYFKDDEKKSNGIFDLGIASTPLIASVLTSVFSLSLPVVGLITTAITSLFSFFKKSSKDNDESLRLEELVSEGISNTISNITPNIAKVIEEAKENLFSSLDEQCEREQKAINEVLSNLIRSKETEVEKFEKLSSDLESDLERLRSIEI